MSNFVACTGLMLIRINYLSCHHWTHRTLAPQHSAVTQMGKSHVWCVKSAVVLSKWALLCVSVCLVLPLISVSQRTPMSPERWALGFNPERQSPASLGQVDIQMGKRRKDSGSENRRKEEGDGGGDYRWRKDKSEVRWEGRSWIIYMVNQVWDEIFNAHFWSFGWVHANQV